MPTIPINYNLRSTGVPVETRSSTVIENKTYTLGKQGSQRDPLSGCGESFDRLSTPFTRFLLVLKMFKLPETKD